MALNNFHNKVALITGGTKGIGLGIAEKLAQHTMRVAITGRDTSETKSVSQDLIKMGASDAVGLTFDIRSYEDTFRSVNEMIARWGQIDIVIANAGVGVFEPIDKLTHEQWSNVIDTNLTGVFNTVSATVDSLKKTKGYIITIASLAGANFFANGAAYNASKFGLVGFTQAIMLDLRKYGIKVTTIMPGSVATYFNNHTPGNEDEWKIQPEDIGQMVIDLLNMHPRTLPSKIEVRPSIPK